jgi:hypothetical protein
MTHSGNLATTTAKLCLLTVLIHPALLLSQEVFTLPPATAAAAYEFRIQTEAGLAPLQWKVINGQLPSGIELLPSVILRGTPSNSRNEPFQFTLEVSDSSQPPQKVSQRFSPAVSAGRLRILPVSAQLKIVPPPQSDPDPPARAEAPTATVDPPGAAQVQDAPETIKAVRERRKKKRGDTSFDPASFVHIYEDTKARNRIQIYDPMRQPEKAGRHLSVDADSSVVIVPDPDILGGNDMPLNKLYMSAVLSSANDKQNVEVVGYSEVGKDKASMEAQRGMAFQTAENIQNMVINMVFTADDIVKYVYEIKEGESVYDPPQQEKIMSGTRAMRGTSEEGKPFRERARERFRLYKPEIQAIGDFFADEHNLAVVRILGSEIFWIDSASLEEIAKQYKENIRIAFDPTSDAGASDQALSDLLERTKLVLADFRDLVLEVRNKASEPSCGKELTGQSLSEGDRKHLLRICGIEKVANERRKTAFQELTKLFASGSISLRSAKATDGNLLTVTVEAVGADGSPVGIPAVFEIDIKKYGAKIQWSPSLLFVRRLGVTDAEASPPTGSTEAPINRVNFAPSPGMTFGIAYFKRGDGKGDAFLRALGPGVGMNVTFMNFNDPSFNLATSQFVNTSGSNVQVGVGLIGSLFDNKLQLSYGWNLNVEHRRQYFGVGFGFIEIGKEVAKYVAK